MNERPAVQVEQARVEVAEKPGHSGGDHQWAGVALGPARPGQEPAGEEGPAHRQVGEPVAGIVPAEPRPFGH